MKIVGLIPDGNRRWAKEKGKSTREGHEVGIANVVRLIEYTRGKVEHMYVYLLAWHNWEREDDELVDLARIIAPVIKKYIDDPFVTLQVGHPPRQVGKPMNVIIRSGGGKRLSGFFPEESKNAKLVVLDKFWPEVTTDDVDAAIQ